MIIPTVQSASRHLMFRFSLVALVGLLGACASIQSQSQPEPEPEPETEPLTTPTPDPGISVESVTPRLGGNIEALSKISAAERAQLQLIATNMVSTLVQIPSMRSGEITLQINDPKTAYGNAIVRALEDAGFGLQRVSADQGRNYVSYSKRLSETEAGFVTDYELSAGKVTLQREYSVQGSRIYPSSLMNIDGEVLIADIELTDAIFAEQGGVNDSFISGVQLMGEPDPNLAVRTVDVRSYDEIPMDRRTPQNEIFDNARLRFFEIQANKTAPRLDRYNKHRRTVLIFEDSTSQIMGSANKLAVRLLVREFSDNDLLLIKACLDADGKNTAALNRAIRVEQELLGYGIPQESTFIAPCARASYRHSSDDSPEPVELVHYRPSAS